MSLILRQSTTKVISFGPFLDKTDGITPETGLVSAIDHASTGILLSKNGGALTIRNAAVTASTYDAYGNYRVTLDTTDTNTCGTLRMQFIETATCLPVWQDFLVVEEAVYDAFYAASALGYIANAPVNVAQLSGDSTAADNAEAFFDGTGYAGTNNVIPTVTTLTNLPAITANWLTAAGTAADFGAEMAAAVWDEDATAHQTAGTFGKAIGDPLAATNSLIQRIPDAVAGAAGGVFIAGSNAATTANITGNLTGNVTGSVGSVTGAVGSVTGAVGSVTGLTASDVAAIKAKTDSLTFTQAGHVDANVQRINDVTIVGDGSATPFNV